MNNRELAPEVGVSRVAELENCLGELLDVLDRDSFGYVAMEEDDQEEIYDAMDRARMVLGREDLDPEDGD